MFPKELNREVRYIMPIKNELNMPQLLWWKIKNKTYKFVWESLKQKPYNREAMIASLFEYLLLNFHRDFKKYSSFNLRKDVETICDGLFDFYNTLESTYDYKFNWETFELTLLGPKKDKNISMKDPGCGCLNSNFIKKISFELATNNETFNKQTQVNPTRRARM